ncbi:MAG: hypothetical protein ACM3NT_04645 [Methylocystaceae bacterium]
MDTTEIKLVFHNQGLRSYIEVDLCADCPRQDDKGCCGYYSPVFYPLDIYYLQENASQILNDIWHLPHLTVLDHSITVNSFPDPNGGYYCQFHRREGGCRLKQEWRESVCRHFVCPGINWQAEASLSDWKNFFAALEDKEIELNQIIASRLSAQGLSLRSPEQRSAWLAELKQIVPAIVKDLPVSSPAPSTALIKRHLEYKENWPL